MKCYLPTTNSICAVGLSVLVAAISGCAAETPTANEEPTAKDTAAIDVPETEVVGCTAAVRIEAIAPTPIGFIAIDRAGIRGLNARLFAVDGLGFETPVVARLAALDAHVHTLLAGVAARAATFGLAVHAPIAVVEAVPMDGLSDTATGSPRAAWPTLPPPPALASQPGHDDIEDARMVGMTDLGELSNARHFVLRIGIAPGYPLETMRVFAGSTIANSIAGFGPTAAVAVRFAECEPIAMH